MSPVSLDFGETSVHYSVHRFVTGESVAELKVTVHRDVHPDGMVTSVIKYVALGVKMVHVINRVGFVSMDANRTGQGIIATYVNQRVMGQPVLWNALTAVQTVRVIITLVPVCMVARRDSTEISATETVTVVPQGVTE